MVHQHFMLIPSFTIAENILLALPGRSRSRIDRKALTQQVRDLAARFGMSIENPEALVSTLPVGSQQRVEILKTLAVSARVLILDEPTAVLTPAEVENLFAVLRRLKQQGYLVLLITHKIPEVLAIADRLSILRRGRLVTTRQTTTCTPQELAHLMIGEMSVPPSRPGKHLRPRSDFESAPPPLLLLENMSTNFTSGDIPLQDVSLALRPGEIVGIAGVDGNGQSELIEVLLGFRTPTQGIVKIRGTQLRQPTPARVRALGVSLIPQDRRREGLALPFSVEENLLLNSQRLSTLAPGLFSTPQFHAPIRRYAN